MIEEVVSVELPVHERLVVRKNRLMNVENGIDMPRISIVTGTHGDELDGQYICYEVIRRIEREKNKLKGIVDIYPDINPLGLDTGSRGIPMFDLDMNRVFPGDNNGAMAEYVAAGIIEDIIGKIDSYETNQENSYLIRLQNKKEKIVRFNNYNQFTLFSLDVD